MAAKLKEFRCKGTPTFEFELPDVEKRLTELVIYLTDKCADDEYFGATKLAKALWHVDVCSYAFRGEPITGLPYTRMPRGPVPKRLREVKATLIKSKELIARNIQFGSYTQKRVIPTREADLSVFKPRDIALIDGVIEFLSGKTATETSNESHMRGWKLAHDGELIPYEAIFLCDTEPTESDIARTRELAHKYQWKN
jgi:hypothetical protein